MCLRLGLVLHGVDPPGYCDRQESVLHRIECALSYCQVFNPHAFPLIVAGCEDVTDRPYASMPLVNVQELRPDGEGWLCDWCHVSIIGLSPENVKPLSQIKTIKGRMAVGLVRRTG